MTDDWLTSPDEVAASLQRERDVRQADDDLAVVASTAEGQRLLGRWLVRLGAEGPVTGDARGLALRNEAEALLEQLARAHPAVCLRLMARLRGIPT